MRVGAALLVMVFAAVGLAQEATNLDSAPTRSGSLVVVPAGTHILLALRSSVSTENARAGDGIYLESAFPVAAGGTIVVPEGTAFQGMVTQAQRSGRIKGRAALQLRVQRMIYRSGYTVDFTSSVQSTPGSSTQSADKQGTLHAESTRARDALLAVGAGVGGGYAGSATGAIVGTIANGSPRTGAAIGGGTGAALGLLAVIAMRGREIRLEPGTMTEIVLENPITIDLSKVGDPPARHEAAQSPRPTPTRTRAVPERRDIFTQLARRHLGF